MLVFSWKTKHDICVLYNLIARDLIIPLMIRRSEVGPACEGRRFPAPDLGPVQLECHPLPCKSVEQFLKWTSPFSVSLSLSFKLNYLLKGSVSDPDSLIPDLDPAFKFKRPSLCAKNLFLSDPFMYACAERCNIPVHKCPNWWVSYSFQCTELKKIWGFLSVWGEKSKQIILLRATYLQYHFRFFFVGGNIFCTKVLTKDTRNQLNTLILVLLLETRVVDPD